MLKAVITKCYEIQIIDENGNAVMIDTDYGHEMARSYCSGDKDEALKEASGLLAYTRFKLGRK